MNNPSPMVRHARLADMAARELGAARSNPCTLPERLAFLETAVRFHQDMLLAETEKAEARRIQQKEGQGQ